MLVQINMSAMEGISLVSVGKGLVGITSLVIFAVLFSRNCKAIDWKLVTIGLTVLCLINVVSVGLGDGFILNQYLAEISGTLVSCMSPTMVGLLLG